MQDLRDAGEAEAELEAKLKRMGLEGEKEKAEKLAGFADLLGKRRKWASLASAGLASDPACGILESLAVAMYPPESSVARAVDIGSGGGLLGITVAIVRERWHMTLVEASRRKSAFLAEVAGTLSLSNVEVFPGRAEGLRDDEGFDLAMTRAAGAMGVTAPLALRLLKSGGLYVALKGAGAAREVEEAAAVIEAAGGRTREVVTGAAARGERAVLLVVVEKL